VLSVKRWILASRPRTLPAAVVPVVVGSALAWQAGGFEIVPAGLCLAFAILIQIGTNFANDYHDFLKGADGAARLGPQRAVAGGLIGPGEMRSATIGILGLAFVLGLGLIPFGGWWLLLIGISSVVLAIAYTAGPIPLAYVGLGDVFVVLYFGIIAVGVTERVQVGHFSGEGIGLGLAVGLLANNLLVVNNHRDAPEDAKVSKKTLAVRLGRRFSRIQYGASLCLAAVVTGWLGFMNGWWVLWIASGIALFGVREVGALREAVTPAAYGTILGATARRLVFFGSALVLGVILG